MRMVAAIRQTSHAAASIGPQTGTIAAHDGLRLHIDAYGETGRRVLLTHGFGQSRLAWERSAASLAAQGYQCLAADGRGHGLSGWNQGSPYHMDQFVEDARSLARHGAGKPIWVGASMGGLIGMVAEAETDGGLFEALVLVDVTPRWETDGVGRILDFMRAHPEGFATLDDARAAVANYLAHRSESERNGRSSSERLSRMLVTMPNGRLRWHWDPQLLIDIGERIDEHFARLNAAAAKLKLPVLLISGGRSDVVSDSTIEEFMKLVPHAEHQRIADATHMVVGDDNLRFTDAVAYFLKRLP